MSEKSFALRAAGAVRRRVYPEVDRLRAEVKELRAENTAARAKLRKQTAPRASAGPDGDAGAAEIMALTSEYTMTGAAKQFALILATRHVVRNGISGDIVECGVWRGGSMHVVARVLDAEGIHDRDIHLFDTYEGMTEPTEKDIRIRGNRPAAELLESSDKTTKVWAVASFEDVQAGLQTLPYPYERFHLVKGPVEETIPEHAPERIALLRLDTDWYESTKHELEHLYERLVPGGVLIIDDYGYWQGSQQATDEFLATLDRPPLLLPAGSGRVGVKP